jgi:hypothetical protein
MGKQKAEACSLRAWLAQQQKENTTIKNRTVTEVVSQRLAQHQISAKGSIWRKFDCAGLLDMPLYAGNPKESAVPSVKADTQTQAKLVMVDGVLSHTHSHLPPGIEVAVASKESVDDDVSWVHFMQKSAPEEIIGAIAWRLSTQVVDVKIEQDMRVEVCFCSTVAAVTAATLRIKVADNVSVVCDRTIDESRCAGGMLLTNLLLELAQGARFDQQMYTDLSAQGAWFETQRALVARDAFLGQAQLMVGGQMLRQCLDVELLGRQAELKVLGVGLGDQCTNHDQSITVHHRASDTSSSQDVKYVVRQKACSHFGSRVVVGEKIKNVQSNQLNHNLLLDKTARALTAPELEVYADEVQCAHGATMGSLDEKALFYLQQRGMNHAQAQALLVEGFVQEQLAKLPDVEQAGAQAMAQRYLQKMVLPAS